MNNRCIAAGKEMTKLHSVSECPKSLILLFEIEGLFANFQTPWIDVLDALVYCDIFSCFKGFIL